MELVPAFRVASLVLEPTGDQGSMTFGAGDQSLSLALAPFFQGAKGDKGDQGDPGPAGAGTSYTHTQAVPAAVWTITHSLGFRPMVYVTDTAGDECVGDVQHLSVTQVQITFSAAFAGSARLT